MAEVTAAAITALVPIVGELDLAAFIAGNAKKDQSEAARLIVHPSPFLEPEQIEEADRGLGVAHPEHSVEKVHWPYLGGGAPLFTAGVTPSISTALAAALPTGPLGSLPAARIQ